MDQTEFSHISELVGIGQKPPAGWIPLKNGPLTIIVGVTGTGKTTTLNMLDLLHSGLARLPGRRLLTDALIIPQAQRMLGRVVEPITDRLERFEMTRAYREQHAGGMAYALTQLWVDGGEQQLMFDGLRGADECGYAAEMLPLAHFVVLDAPAGVRVQRLLQRNDSFDQVTTSTPTDGLLEFKFPPDLLTSEEQQQIEALFLNGDVTLEEIRDKVAIVQKEAENYNPSAAIEALQHKAPNRTLIIDTVENTLEEAAKHIIEFLGLKES